MSSPKPIAFLLSDRVILMAARPGRIIADIEIGLERPRTQEMRTSSDVFRQHFEELSDLLRKEVLAVDSAQGDK